MGGRRSGRRADAVALPAAGRPDSREGRARGEIPWFGLLKLTLDPARSGTKCCDGWGDPLAPRNSWDSLTIALPLVFGAPFIVGGGPWAWGKFITPGRHECVGGE